jgi:hypothetical protein
MIADYLLSGRESLSNHNCSHDQKQPCPDRNGPYGPPDALTGRRETFHRNGYCHDSHRAKVHDPNDQEDRHQTHTAAATVQPKAQAVSPSPSNISR